MAHLAAHVDDDQGHPGFEEEDDSDVEMTPSTHGYLPVENSSNATEAELKAQEAAAEQRRGTSSAALPSQLSSPALSATSMPWSEPDVPDLNANPPDYATAMANQPSYGSTQRHAVDSSLAAGQHQSMSDAVPADSDEETGLLAQGHSKKRKRRGVPGCCGPISTCNIVLILAVIALIVLLSRVATSGHDGNGGDNTDPEVPKTPDDKDDNDQDPSRRPIRQPYFPKATCAYKHYSKSEYLDFASPQNFTLSEFMGFMERLPFTEGVEGTLHVQPSDQLEQGVDIRVTIAYATTSEFHVTRSNYILDRDSLALDMPDIQVPQELPHGKTCLGVFVGIEVRQGVELENWALLTGNLDIVVTDGLFDSASGTKEQPHLTVNGNSTFSTIAGDGDIAYWSSRRTIIEFVSGNIRGAFALCDYLYLKTLSGNIDATVDPKRADPAHVTPAEFSAISTSGSIDVKFPITGDELPSRDYQTSLQTISSPIRGSYIIGTLLTAHTTSGDIDAELLPYYADKQPSSIHTDSKSGETILNVLLPYSDDSWPSIKSEHRSTSTSGSINVTYPSQWEGQMDAETLSGGISIKGKGLKVIDESRGPVLKRVKAEKGSGPGHMGFKTLSGNVNVRIDDN